jgi:hypothetical protein
MARDESALEFLPGFRYRDGTTHVLLEPLDFLARLAALVPPPRAHLTRYHGALAAAPTPQPAG